MFITVGAVIGTAGILLKYGRVTDREIVTRQAKPKIPSIWFTLVNRCKILLHTKPIKVLIHYRRSIMLNCVLI